MRVVLDTSVWVSALLWPGLPIAFFLMPPGKAAGPGQRRVLKSSCGGVNDGTAGEHDQIHLQGL